MRHSRWEWIAGSPVCGSTGNGEPVSQEPVCRATGTPPAWKGCIGTLAGFNVAAVRSGMGPVRAQQAAASLIRKMQPQCLIVAGFASGLRSGLPPGALVVADDVFWFASPGLDDPASLRTAQPDPGLLDIARRASAGEAPVVGGVLSLDALLRDPSAKAYAASLVPQAIAADMETAWAAAAAISAGVPWIAVRCVTDGIEDTLPLPFDQYLGPDGEVASARLPRAILREPWSLVGLVRLGARSFRAAGNLAAFVEAFLQILHNRR